MRPRRDRRDLAEEPAGEECRHRASRHPRRQRCSRGNTRPKPTPKPGTIAAAAIARGEASADGRRVIVIDPGHGGIDPGAVGVRRTREKDVVLAFAAGPCATS